MKNLTFKTIDKTSLQGRLINEPEIREYNGKLIAVYTIYVTNGMRCKNKNNERKNIKIKCAAFGQHAKMAEKYHKNTAIAVEGTIITGSYTDANEKTVRSTDVFVESQMRIDSIYNAIERSRSYRK